MKKHKKKVFLSLSLALGISSFLFLIKPSEKGLQITKAKKQIIKNKKPIIKRGIASTPQTPKKKQVPVDSNDRVFIGRVTDINNITYLNKVDKDWKKKYQKNFERMLFGKKIKDFKIDHRRSVVSVQNNIGQNLEHIIVSFKRPDGSPQSFEAYIDSETGTMIQSWNKTRSEIKKGFQISGNKYLYKKEQ